MKIVWDVTHEVNNVFDCPRRRREGLPHLLRISARAQRGARHVWEQRPKRQQGMVAVIWDLIAKRVTVRANTSWRFTKQTRFYCTCRTCDSCLTFLLCFLFLKICTPLVSDCGLPTGLVIGQAGQSRVYTLQWIAPKGVQIDQYSIEYLEASEHLPSYAVISSAVTKYNLDLTSTEPGGSYTVRVQAICGGQAGEWSRSVVISDGRRSELTCVSF